MAKNTGSNNNDVLSNMTSIGTDDMLMQGKINIKNIIRTYQRNFKIH